MKKSLQWASAFLLLASFTTSFYTVQAQGTAFTYQGRLNIGNSPATGVYDMQFALSNAVSGGSQIGSTITSPGINVSNGLFITTLDFNNVFNGQSAWLSIGVRSNGTGNYAGLTPPQAITPTPYAMYAEGANALNLTGTIPTANLSGVALLGAGNTFTADQTVLGQVTAGGGAGALTMLDRFHPVNAFGWQWTSEGKGLTATRFNGGGGSSFFNIATNGLVGIGTATPVSALQVNGTVTATAFSGDGTSLTGVAKTGSANTFTGNQIVSSGSVGIGTSSPTTALQVNGTVTATTFSGSGTSLTGVAKTGSANTFTGNQIVSSGSVGIGTSSPSTALQVNGTVTATAVNATTVTGGSFSGPGDGLSDVALTTTANTFNGQQIIVGKVGINNTTPSANLDVSGTGNFSNGLGVGGVATHGAFEVGFTGGSFAYTSDNAGFASSGNLGPFGANNSARSAIYANGGVFTTGSFIAISDQRVKTIIGHSDAARDLNTLMGIEITDFRYKDVIEHGTAPSKKVIAQQVEKVFPQAVTRRTGEVPDIYHRATIQDGWINLATDLKKGERVKLIADRANGVYEVLEVKDGAFRTDFKPADGKIFVYGRQVNDFRSVDYDAIAMLNVSATQEMERNAEAQKATLAKQQEALTQLQNKLDQSAAEKAALLKRLAVLEARDQAREDRLARLESSLEKNTSHPLYAAVHPVQP